VKLEGLSMAKVLYFGTSDDFKKFEIALMLIEFYLFTR
jgi:hypothetical protein